MSPVSSQEISSKVDEVFLTRLGYLGDSMQ